MIEARTVAFILIILLIAFIVYRLCLSNERKTKGGFDNLNDVVLAVYDSIEKGAKLEDIDIAAAKLEVLKTLNLVLEGSQDLNKTLKSEFYDKLSSDEQKLAFIEALIHSLYVEGYVPSEFIGCNVAKKQVILEARHNYKYSYITIYLKDLDNEIYDMSKYLNAIKDGTKYKISICNSIKAHSVSRYCRWGVYECVKKDNKTMDIDYEEGVDDSSDILNVSIPDGKKYDIFNSRNNSADININSGILYRIQPENIDASIMQNNSIPITDNNGPRIDESNDDDNNLNLSNIQETNNSAVLNLDDSSISPNNTKDEGKDTEQKQEHVGMQTTGDLITVF